MMLASFHSENLLLYHYDPYSNASLRRASVDDSNPFACFGSVSDAFFDGLSYLGTSIVKSLERVHNSVSYYGKLYLFGFDKHDIDTMTYDFAANLLSVASTESIEHSDAKAGEITLLSRQSLRQILLKFKQETDLRDVSALIKFVSQRQHEHMSIEEWAHVSLTLDKIFIDLKKKLEDTNATSDKEEATARRGQLVLMNLSNLKFLSRVAWGHLAEQKTKAALEVHYKPLWKLGYARIFSGNVSAGGSVGGLFDMGATAGIKGVLKYKAEKFADEEGNYCERNLKSAGMNAEIKADFAALAKASAEINGELSSGTYKQWHSAPLYVASQFSSLIQMQIHRNNPEIARYLSRSSTLAAQHQSQIKPDPVLLAATENELTEIDKLRAGYELRKPRIEQQLALFMTTGDWIQAPISLAPITASPTSFVKAHIVGNTEKATVAAEVGSGVFSISASTQRKHLVRQMKTNTALCKRLSDKTKSPEEKKAIQRQLKSQFSRYKDTLPICQEDSLASIFSLFKQGFTFYTQLQAAIAMNGRATPEDEACLKNCMAQYGAKNVEQFIHRLIIGNAYLFSLADEEGNDALKKELQDFEQTLLSPSFDVDKRYLKKRAYFREYVEYELIDKKLIIEATACGSKFKFEGIHRRQIHANPLRNASYLDGAVTITGGIGNITDLINALAPVFTENLPEQLAKQALDQLKHQLEKTEPIGVLESGTSFYFRTCKPVMFSHVDDFSYRPFFKRESGVIYAKGGVNISIPVGVANINVGFELSASSFDCKKEVIASDSLLYPALLYMHDVNINLIDRKTGLVAPDSAWNTLREEQKNALLQLFINYANEMALQKTMQPGSNNAPLAPSAAPGLISQEIDEIGRLIEANPHLDATAYPAWCDAAIQFKNAVPHCVQDATSDAPFLLALSCLEKLLHAYYPHWSERKSNSDLLKPMPLAPVEI